VFGKVWLGVYDREDDQEDQTKDAADCNAEESKADVVFSEVVAGEPDIFEGCEEGV